MEGRDGISPRVQQNGETRSVAAVSPLAAYRQLSFCMKEPLAGVVMELFGSDSQVMAPLNLRMYLYSTTVFAGSVTVTMKRH